jgi:AcrR family transcriptional regulator
VPKEVDHDERRDEILTAVAGLLADVGLRGLTIRSLAARMGGSVSMVTHYFPTRHSLLLNIGPWVLRKWQTEIESLESAEGDPVSKLRVVLSWLIPITPEGMLEERAGLSLLVGTEPDATAVQGLRTGLDLWLRGLVRAHLIGLVDAAHIEPTVDILYAVTRGISVSACEAPEAWPAERQLTVLDDLLDLLGLLQPGTRPVSRMKDMGIAMHRCDCGKEEES